MSLPIPSPEALAHSEALCALLGDEIRTQGGWISFARFMELALYAPGLGYYSGGAQKFGSAGDFVTAPEISPLFGRTLAVQVAQVMAASAPDILEPGAGTGALAADLLLALEAMGSLPERYRILELSGELRARQRATLEARAPHLLPRVSWLDRLPEAFSGVVVANEVLDAMPVHLVHWVDGGIFERGVALDADAAFTWQDHPATGALLAAAQSVPVAAPYLSEIALAAPAWIREWAQILQSGALILVDYGFPQREFYHPQRNQGTLMCHYRHHAHGEPFHRPGLTDITAHVDFTAVVEAGVNAGLELLGYAGQGQFLLNCGLTQVLEHHTPAEGTAGADYLRLASGAQKLISPSEMGELFKVMVLGRGIEEPLVGFIRGDRSHTL
ncbi:MAG: SAM-dependent methyltransferase [Rhodocyclaceae bacterium]|nr:SAM-dependent methyltransferase [Rhodocyclaceae bacterium]